MAGRVGESSSNTNLSCSKKSKVEKNRDSSATQKTESVYEAYGPDKGEKRVPSPSHIYNKEPTSPSAGRNSPTSVQAPPRRRIKLDRGRWNSVNSESRRTSQSSRISSEEVTNSSTAMNLATSTQEPSSHKVTRKRPAEDRQPERTSKFSRIDSDASTSSSAPSSLVPSSQLELESERGKLIARDSLSPQDTTLPSGDIKKDVFLKLMELFSKERRRKYPLKGKVDDNFEQFLSQLKDHATLSNREEISTEDKFYHSLGQLDSEKWGLLYKVLSKESPKSVLHLIKLIDVVKNSKTDSEDIILFIYRFDIQARDVFVEVMSPYKNHFDRFSSLYELLKNEAKSYNEQKLVKDSSTILRAWIEGRDQSQESFNFFLEVVKRCHTSNVDIILAIESVVQKQFYSYYKSLKDPVDQKICLDYFVWRKFEAHPKEIEIFIKEATNTYTLNTVINILHSSIIEKHLDETLNKKNAERKARDRLIKNADLTGGSSVLMATRAVFIKGVALALRANSVLIAQFLNQEVELRGGDYQRYRFPLKHGFSLEASSHRFAYLGSRNGKVLYYEWKALEFNLKKTRDGQLIITHCVPSLFYND